MSRVAVKTIFIADHESIFVDCLSSSLRSENGFDVIGSSANGAEAYAEIKERKPDLLITDLNLSDISGIHLIRKIKAIELPTRVILLSSAITPTAIHKALSAGVDGIILKSDNYSLLIEAIMVIAQRKFLSPGISDPLVNNFLSFSENSGYQKVSPLSDREEQVAKMISDGINSKQIADILSISEKTVSKHRSNIFRKLNVSNTVQLVKYVLDNNLIG